MRTTTRDRLGGPEGNEILTAGVATILTVLLIGEGITLLRMNGLRGVHMFIGLALIPPVLLKLASTGYRFARYYTGARPYRAKGPPLLPLRLLAPVLVVSTVGIFASGVWLLLLGHKSDQVLLLHKASFIVWAAVFGIHFLAYLPRMLGSLGDGWSASRGHAVAGSGWRWMLVVAALGAGIALAVSLLATIGGYHGGPLG